MCLFFLLQFGLIATVQITIYPPGNNFFDIINSVVAGDEIILAEGIYSTFTGSSWYRYLTIRGTPERPIIIRAQEGATVVFSGDPNFSQNVLNIEGSNFVFSGIEFRSGSFGIRLYANVFNATFENLYIHDLSPAGTAFTGNIGNTSNVIVKNCRIGPGVANGINIGCQGCFSIGNRIENNWVSALLTFGIRTTLSVNPIIKDNVVSGLGLTAIYVSETTGGIIDGNALLSPRESGIEACSGTIVRNNIIIGARNGIADSSQINPNDAIQIYHNTVYGADVCLSLHFSNGQLVNVKNNVFFCSGREAVNMSGTGITFNKNSMLGTNTGAPANLNNVDASESDLTDPSNRNVFPSKNSKLKGAGDSSLTSSFDFNGSPRNQNAPTIGAYEWAESNPGWQIQDGFKGNNTSEASNENSDKAALYASISVVILLLILGGLLVAFFLIRRRMKNKKETKMEVIEMEATSPKDDTQYSPIANFTPEHDYIHFNAPNDQEKNSPKKKTMRVSKYDIKLDELTIGPLIGSGSSGSVYKGQWRSSTVAIKILRNTGDIRRDNLQEFIKEAELMKDMQPHPNVVTFIGVVTNPFCIVTEYLENGSLIKYVRSDVEISLQLKIKIMGDIAAGMYHLQMEKIVHKDLAARNILLGREYIAKVSDFGLSRLTTPTESSVISNNTIGPVKWMAWESLQKRVYSVKTDVWAFGVTCWEILTRDAPFKDIPILEFTMRVVPDKLTLKDHIPKECPEALAEILRSCWNEKPEDRPDFKRITEFFQSLNNQ